MERKLLLITLLVLSCTYGCSKNSSSDTPFGSGNVPYITREASSTLPTGMKTGGALSLSLMDMFREGAGNFARAIGDPLGSESVSPPPSAGNILWLVWNMDYNSYCTDDKIAAGECFKVHPSVSTTEWTKYYRPAALADPTICRTNGNYSSIIGTSMVSEACKFEYMLLESGTSVDKCYESTGQSVDITTWIPWASSWGLPTSIKFQGSFGGSTWANWFGLNRTVTGADGQYMITLSNEAGSSMGPYLTAVNLDRVNNKFFHLTAQTGSGSVQGIKAYQGALPTGSSTQSSGAFEALQILDYNGVGTMGSSSFSIRMKSDGTYVWIQSWSNKVPGDNGFDASSPDTSECLQFGSTLPASYYVSAEDGQACLAAFGKTKTQMNADTNYDLKLTTVGTTVSSWWEKGGTLYDAATTPIATLGNCYQ
ncbi:MAG: hypothetical protein AABZ06_11900 [Bdellovibrionota bacterium]